ncbi:hypothetical protein CON36_36325 [Bacillus cereus]|uniref:Uncharacterized protein n=1 Tax=Bacillus cereus TaxID=1396 RepID=A0A9X6SRW0_BACCE|nr:hypothetical protein [Bacillus cereus]PDZ93971.1 hypothetical protein CON36_36325 [Bacillus cereus]
MKDDYLEDIHDYGEYINDFEVSPFESIFMLHIRSRLKNEYEKLTNEEKKILNDYDNELRQSAHKMYEHLKLAYDFEKSNKPEDEWWWHLDRLV